MDALKIVAVQFELRNADQVSRVLEDINRRSDQAAVKLAATGRSTEAGAQAMGHMGRQGSMASQALGVVNTTLGGVAVGMGNLILKAGAVAAGLAGIGSAAGIFATLKEAIGQDTEIAKINTTLAQSAEANAVLRRQLIGLGVDANKGLNDVAAGFDLALKFTQDYDQALQVVRQSADYVIGSQGSFAQAIDLGLPVLQAWGKEVQDLPQLYDLLAQSGNLASFDQELMARALARMGPAAQQFNLGLDNSIALLTFFARQSKDSRRAVSGFEMVMQRLGDLRAAPSSQIEEMAGSSGAIRETMRTIQGADASFEDIIRTMARTGITYDELGILFDSTSAAVLLPLIQDLRKGGQAFGMLQQKMKDAAGAAKGNADVMRNDLGIQLQQIMLGFGEVATELAHKAVPGMARFGEQGKTLAEELVGVVQGTDDFGTALERVVDVLKERGVFETVGQAIGSAVTAGFEIAAASIPSVVEGIWGDLPPWVKIVLSGSVGAALGKRFGFSPFLGFGIGAIQGLAVSGEGGVPKTEGEFTAMLERQIGRLNEASAPPAAENTEAGAGVTPTNKELPPAGGQPLAAGAGVAPAAQTEPLQEQPGGLAAAAEFLGKLDPGLVVSAASLGTSLTLAKLLPKVLGVGGWVGTALGLAAGAGIELLGGKVVDGLTLGRRLKEGLLEDVSLLGAPQEQRLAALEPIVHQVYRARGGYGGGFEQILGQLGGQRAGLLDTAQLVGGLDLAQTAKLALLDQQIVDLFAMQRKSLERFPMLASIDAGKTEQLAGAFNLEELQAELNMGLTALQEAQRTGLQAAAGQRVLVDAGTLNITLSADAAGAAQVLNDPEFKTYVDGLRRQFGNDIAAYVEGRQRTQAARLRTAGAIPQGGQQ